MSRNLPPFAALRAFEAAAETLSFKQAAEVLSLTPSAISHQIKGLESWMGVPLFERKSRQIALTPAGEALLPPLRQAFENIEKAASAVAAGDYATLQAMAGPGSRTGDTRTGSRTPAERIADQPETAGNDPAESSPPENRTVENRTTLQILAGPGLRSRFLDNWLSGLDPALQAGLDIHLFERDAAFSDASLGAFLSGQGEGAEKQPDALPLAICFAMSSAALRGTDRIVLPLCRHGQIPPDVIPLCSPRLARGAGALTGLDSLSLQRLLHSRERPRDWTCWLDARHVPVEGTGGVERDKGPCFDTVDQALQAAALGMGVALALPAEAESWLEDGKLIHPFDAAPVDGAGYWLVMPEREDPASRAPALTGFIQALTGQGG